MKVVLKGKLIVLAAYKKKKKKKQKEVSIIKTSRQEEIIKMRAEPKELKGSNQYPQTSYLWLHM
jgi:hypothetical protein